MKQWMYGLMVISSLASVSAVADTLDGAGILAAEAEKARQLEELEYKARLVEQKAKLAKAYKSLQESSGYSSGEHSLPGRKEVRSAVAAPRVTKQSSTAAFQLPALQSISGNYALFELNGKIIQGVAGGQLPGGFKVLSVNATEGVRLRHNGNIYTLDIAWTSGEK